MEFDEYVWKKYRMASAVEISANIEKDEKETLFPVLFMFLSFGSMIASLGAILFFQDYFAYAICALLYAGVVAIELRFGIKSPVSISMLLLYAGLAILDGVTKDYTGYAGIIIFAWLTTLSTALLLFGKPFTTFYSNGKGLRSLHFASSLIWTAAYALSLLASVLLMPDILYLVVPFALCISFGLLTIFLNLVWFGRGHGRQTRFAIQEFEFHRLLSDSPEFPLFCDFFARQIYRPGEDGNMKTVEEIAEIVSRTEKELAADSYIFVAKDEGRIVGCMRCILDRKGRPFPLEAEMDSSLDPLRRIGRLMHVGRLAVDDRYRERPDVLNGLFKCFLDLSLSQDVSFVVAEGYRHRLPTYLKLGFEIMFDRSDRRHAVKMAYGYVCYPLFMNFAFLVFNRDDASMKRYHFSDFINPYLAERWYKRAGLRCFFRSRQLWPWRFTLRQVKALV
ncbi:MAG: hypothetical protein V4673_06920 [Pseudomonadota bacterium]